MKFALNAAKPVEELGVIRVPYQYVATITGSIAVICTGMIFAWPTLTLPKLLAPDSPIPITTSQGAWLAVLPCITAALGCLLAAYFVDKIGRKLIMLTVTPLYFTGWIMIANSNSLLVYFCARFLSGIGDGMAFTAFPMYLGEIADSNIRGMLSASIAITTVTGLMLMAIISSQFSIYSTAIISSILPLVHFILFCFMPESPYFLLMKGKEEKAKQELIKLRGHDNVDDEINRLRKSVKEESEHKGSIWDLFTVKSNRKAVYIVVGLRGFQQCCGAMAITFYATVIFQESGSTLSPDSCTSIYFGIQLICSLICSMLVDKIGRRPLLIASTFGATFALAIEGSYFYIRDYTQFDLSNLTLIPVIALLIFNILFNLGMGTIPVIMLGELFPTNVKAFALCLADIYFGVIVVIASKFFQIMNDLYGMHVPFFAFSGCSMLAMVYIVFCIPETKGKTLEEIQEYFKTSKKNLKKGLEKNGGTGT